MLAHGSCRQLLLSVLRRALQLYQLHDLVKLSATPRRLIQGATHSLHRQRLIHLLLPLLRQPLQLYQLHDIVKLSPPSRRLIQRAPRSFPLRGGVRGACVFRSGRSSPSVQYDGSCLRRERVRSRKVTQEIDCRHSWSLHV